MIRKEILYRYLSICLSLGLFIFTFCSNDSSITEPTVEFDYLGQTPPGLTPQPFAHSIFRNFALHSSPAFSNDGNEVFWSAFDMSSPGSYKLRLFYMKKENGIWKDPTKATFLLNGVGDSPIFSPDGNKLFFLSGAPTSQNPNNTKENLYYSNKTENGWSEPVMLGQEFDSYIFHWQVAIANNGNLYFSGDKLENTNKVERDIYLAHLVDGEYENFTNLGDSVNVTGEIESTPWVSPDDSFIIVSRGGDNEFSEMYISFKKSDGTWSKAKKMVGVNSEYHDLNPIITPDKKYLIYTSESDGWPYWIDASVIERFK